MNIFAAAQIAALRQLRNLWRGIDFCLIGASALRCHVDLPRPTNDLDLTISISLNAFPAGLEKLPGWRQHSTKEHEWHGPGDVQVDVVPAGTELLAQGAVTWPRSGHTMSLLGMRLAFATASPFGITRDVDVPLPKLHALALLKIVSYLDRPHHRERDLADFAFVLDNYVPSHEERLFSTEVPERIDLFRRPAFLLGLDLRGALNSFEREAVNRFVALVRGSGADTTRSRFIRLAPRRWHGAGEAELELDAVLDAFEKGLGAIPST
jgi:predicted nucleotidyltransferase